MSSFPPRCFTCGKVINGFWETYSERVDAKEDPYVILDDLHIGRACCRRMFITHVDIDRFADMYPTYPGRIQRIGPKHKIKRVDSRSSEDQSEEEVDEESEDVPVEESEELEDEEPEEESDDEVSEDENSEEDEVSDVDNSDDE